jgi:hypothetical protein
VTVTASTSWVEQAACRGRDTHLWFSGDRHEQDLALAICHRCRVQVECLAEAVELEADGTYHHGVRGGLTAAQRARPHSVSS